MKLFRKPNSKYYWYDVMVRGRRYRASTQETKSVRALRVASMQLASLLQNKTHFQASLLRSVGLLNSFSTG